MVSVVIPLYNKVSYVCRAIETVLNQTFQDIEIVVVDDGSSDGGGALVERMAYPKCKVFHQPNGGESAARNKGVEIARYDLIAFLDADDEWLPDFLAASVSLHNRWPEIVASFTNYLRSDSRLSALPDRMTPGPLASYFEFCLQNGGSGMWTGANMIKKSALIKAGGFPVGRKMGPDLDTWFRVACQGPMAYEPTPLAIYFCDRGVCSTSKVDCDIWSTFDGWRNSGRIPRAQLASAERFAVMLRLITVAMRCRDNDLADARRMLSALPPGRLWSARRLACAFAAWGRVFPARYWLGVASRLGVQIYWPATN